MVRLTEDEIAAALAELPGWSRDGDVLVATFRRKDWTDALGFVNRIGDEAERRNHHPDVCITGYRTVTIRLTTHSEGGVSRRDVSLAGWIGEQSEVSG
jgi:4a-hydroxytetrahydrobiopterin dehydratase